MKVVADTDILSTFARVHRLDILKKLFDQITIPQSVKSELREGKIDVKPLNPVLVKLTKDELKVLRTSSIGLGKGESECLVIAKSRNIPLASNDRTVQSLCKKEGIGYFTLPIILRMGILDRVITREDAKEIVKLIEHEEHTKIKNKDEIFR